MQVIRKTWSLFLASALCVTSFSALANDFPSRPIKFVVPIAPGSGLDSNTRFVVEKAATLLGQATVVENRPGGNTIIGTQAVLGAPADGYTVLVISPSSMVINPVMRKDLPYDALRDIRPISGMNRSSAVLVTAAGSPYNSLQDLVSASKKKPGSVTFANYSEFYRLGAAVLEKDAAIEFNHIPYKGAAEVITNLIGGSIDVALIASGAAAPLVKSGKLRALAVTGKERIDIPEYRNIPTVAESGYPGFELFVWTGFGVKAGTPESAVHKLQDALSRVVGSPEFQRFLLAQGGEIPFISNGAQIADMVRDDTIRYKKILATVK